MQYDRVSANKQCEAESVQFFPWVSDSNVKQNAVTLPLYSPPLMKHSFSLNIAYVVKFCWYINFLWIINPCPVILLSFFHYRPIKPKAVVTKPVEVFRKLLIWICSQTHIVINNTGIHVPGCFHSSKCSGLVENGKKYWGNVTICTWILICGNTNLLYLGTWPNLTQNFTER